MLFEHSEGVITAIGGEDDRDEYEIDLVVGNEVVETNVLEDSTVREEGRASSDEDAVREAQPAQVSTEDATRTAVEGRDGQVLDEAELDEDDGSLHWEIELDQAEGGDGDQAEGGDANIDETIPG